MLVALTVLVVVVGAVVVVLRETVVPFLRGESCTATVAGHTVEVSIEQAENAAVIAGIAARRGLPPRETAVDELASFTPPDAAIKVICGPS